MVAGDMRTHGPTVVLVSCASLDQARRLSAALVEPSRSRGSHGNQEVAYITAVAGYFVVGGRVGVVDLLTKKIRRVSCYQSSHCGDPPERGHVRHDVLHRRGGGATGLADC